ncbi:MAG TPA: DUF983 domain-containing protein [Planctomicrobium sp.]|nr:DUF983 domain-containing protein [Planctomicrobium sp.]
MGMLKPTLTALRKRCPRCEQGKLFHRFSKMHRQCPQCGLPLAPGPGYYIGALYPNYAVTFLVVTAVYWIMLFGLGVDQKTTLWTSLALLFILPVLFNPYARSLWLSMMYHASSNPTTKDWRDSDDREESESKDVLGEPPHIQQKT